MYAWFRTMDFIKNNVSVISAATALLAVFFGPLVTYLIGKKQIYGNLVIANRIKWVESLREDVVEFCELYATAIDKLEEFHKATTEEEKRRVDEENGKIQYRLSRLRISIGFRLEFDKKSHAELNKILFGTIKELEGATNNKDYEPLSAQGLVIKLAGVATEIFDREWAKIRHLA